MATAFGGVAIVLGYILFRVGVRSLGDMTIENPRLKFRLLTMGPGLFFALFGAVILWHSISTRTLSQQQRWPAPSSPSTPASSNHVDLVETVVRVNLGGEDRRRLSRALAAIKTLSKQLPSHPDSLPKPDSLDWSQVSQAMAVLTEERDTCLRELFGAKALRFYGENAHDAILNSHNYSSEQLESIEEMRPWVDYDLRQMQPASRP
ncbi:MAG: hypothetical protein H7A47_14940 [Verrucomicrobiales bacterium]|nr:hypothetical protein [Verrucomicrobiales bacterium]